MVDSNKKNIMEGIVGDQCLVESLGINLYLRCNFSTQELTKFKIKSINQRNLLQPISKNIVKNKTVEILLI